MKTTELLALCQSKGISVGVVEGKLKVLDPNKHLDATLMGHLKANKAQLLAFFSQSQGYTASDFPHARLRTEEVEVLLRTYPDCEKLYMATPLQSGLLFHGLWDESGASYTSQSFLDFTVGVNVDVLRQAWEQTVARYDVLRTCFVGLESENIHQLVRRSVELPVTVLDWRERYAGAVDERQIQADVATLHREDKQAGFDFSQAPLMRITLVHLPDNRVHFLWTYHHILLDGWCVPQLLEEVQMIYRGLQQGKALKDESLGLSLVVPYERYIGWLQAQDSDKARGYWQARLANTDGATPFLHEPALSGEQAKADDFEEVGFRLSPTVTEQLQTLSRLSRSTMNVVLQGAWSYLLSRYSGRAQVMFGTVVSGRPASLAGVEKMIGLFINTVPVVVDVDESLSVGEWLRQLHSESVRASEYDFLSLSEIQGLSPSGAGVGLFDSLLVYENQPGQSAYSAVSGESGAETDTASSLVTGSSTATADTNTAAAGASSAGSDERTEYAVLLRSKLLGNQELECEFHYHSNQIAPRLAKRMLAQLERLLTQLGAGGVDYSVSQLEILDSVEQAQLTRDWQGEVQAPAALLGQDKTLSQDKTPCIHEIFAARAEAIPDATALVCEGERLSYQALNARANQLAHYLIQQGVSRGTLVGVCTGRDFDVVISVLAVLKAGGAYVPLEPDYPISRLHDMVSDAGVDYLLTQSALQSRVSELSARHVICVDEASLCDALNALPTSQPEVAVEASDLCYVIYTSGSTGKPKGVMAQHDGVLNRFEWMWRVYPFGDDEVCCSKSALSFVDSVWELLGGLLAGVPTVLLSRDVVLDSTGFLQALSRHRVSRLVVVPSLLDVMLEEDAAFSDCLSHLRYVTVSGEKLSPTLATRFAAFAPDCVLLNLYGSSEVAADVTCFEINADSRLDSNHSVIGRPIDNMQVWVLDEQKRCCPVGVPGELYVAGPGVARGYWGNPALTAARFIANPFARDYERMFRTGDIVKWLDDGNLAFLGRVDRQIKHNGIRIEVGEIETALSLHSIVEKALVTQLKVQSKVNESTDDKASFRLSLVAYLVLKRPVSSDEEEEVRQQLRAWLLESVPANVLPGTFIFLEGFPLNANGKIDVKNLPEPDDLQQSTQGYVAPQSANDKKLSDIWAECLGLEKVGMHDNFFQLGGTSLLAIRVISKAKKAGLHVTMQQLWQHQTIAELSQILQTTNIQEQPEHFEKRLEAQSKIPLLPAQYRFFEGQNPNENHFNCATMCEVRVKLDTSLFEQAIRYVLTKHDALRMVFHTDSDDWYQTAVDVPDKMPLEIFTLDNGSNEAVDEQIKQHVHTLQTSLNIKTGELTRFAIFNLPDDQPQRLLFICHHLVLDGFSMEFILDELINTYSTLLQGKPLADAPEYSHYGQALSSLKEMAISELKPEADYWLNHIPDEMKKVPTDYANSMQKNRFNTVHFFIDKWVEEEATQIIMHDIPAREKVNSVAVVLHALSLFVAQWNEQSPMLIDLMRFGREVKDNKVDLSECLGWHAVTIPYFVDSASASDHLAAIKKIHDGLEAIPYSGTNLGLLKYLCDDHEITDKLRNKPHPELMLNFFPAEASNAPQEQDPVLKWLEFPLDPYVAPNNFNGYMLTIWVSEIGEKLGIGVQYSDQFYANETIGHLIDLFIKQMDKVAFWYRDNR